MSLPSEYFDKMADQWWNDTSWPAILRTGLNEGRFGYFRRKMAEHGVEPRGLKILDVGCGGGLLSEEFARIGCDVTGIDYSAETVKVAAAHARMSGLEIAYQQASAESLPFPDASFDLVYCCDVLEHVNDVGLSVREGARVLKPGGLYLFDTINRTVRANLVAVKLLQEWTKIVPPEIHEYDKFIKPTELADFCASAGMRQVEVLGLGPRVPTWKLGWLVWQHHRKKLSLIELGRLLQIGEIPDVSVSYMGFAQRNS